MEAPAPSSLTGWNSRSTMIHRPGTSSPSIVSRHTAIPAGFHLMHDAIPIGIGWSAESRTPIDLGTRP
jgi:hypothetical protein